MSFFDIDDLSDIQKSLSPVQWEAVSTFKGPCLILSGAGSGKTRVLTYKIAALIRMGHCLPSNILAVTFTNKAAGEMRHRAEKLLGASLQLPWLGTFHSICAKLLRIHGELLGFTSSFTIYDRDDQKRFLKKLIKEVQNSSYTFTPETLRFHFGGFKNRGLLPAEVSRNASGGEEQAVAQFYFQYQKKLLEHNAMDFDDLMLHTCALLKNHPEVASQYQSRFKYILIDEFQDTNRVQFELIHALLGPHHNITLVGDDDQSIYGWRGAEIANILDFQKTFPEGKVIEMGENYRSTGNIIGAAYSVIVKNSQRLGKRIFTENELGEKVKIKKFEDETEEARWVIQEISQLSPQEWGGCAVFYRTNAQSRMFEDMLRRNRIPYQLIGSIRFYDRKEIKDVLAYLQALSNPADSVSLGRIINVPKRGIGEKTIENLADTALAKQCTLLEALKAEVQGPSNAQNKKLLPFVELWYRLEAEKNQLGIRDFVEFVIQETRYREYLEAEGEGESIDRIGNVDELISAAEDYETIHEGKTLADFLQEIALYTQMDEVKDGQGAVSLMTVHSAKGLEFPRVYITGMEEGLFPMYRDGEPDEIEEERRLFYVAITRAEKKLTITQTLYRRTWGRVTGLGPSRFLKEIDPQFLESIAAQKKQHDIYTYEPVEDPFAGDQNPADFGVQPGRSVDHPKFGPGKITHVEGQGEATKVTIHFLGYGSKKLLLKFAKLSVVD